MNGPLGLDRAHATGEKGRGISYLRSGEVRRVASFRPTMTVLEFLREELRQTGTKEGCAEGDCGACTVVIGSLDRSGELKYRAVNSCIQLLGTLDGKELITVEDLAGEDLAGDNSPAGNWGLHPVQAALVEHHASQCGFCTPGFVMALLALYHGPRPVTRAQVEEALAGNLCRCTGYRPIVDAALAACAGAPNDRFSARAADTVRLLRGLNADGAVPLACNQAGSFLAPRTADQLAAVYAARPDATIVAGATDVGLWITKELKDLPQIVYVGGVEELARIEDTDEELKIGAACTYSDAFDALARIDPDIGEVLRRLGSPQIRNAGTIGGNIANGSPIGDTPPILIALGAELELRGGETTRRLPIEEFFIAYGKQDRVAGEFLARVTVPKLGAATAFRCYKISKRFDQDISSLLGAFALQIAEGRVKAARIAYGGMAATPKRALAAERALVGARLDTPADWRAAIDALGEDFSPMSDHRASAAYRQQTAKALLEKCLIEVAGADQPTRVVGEREVGHG